MNYSIESMRLLNAMQSMSNQCFGNSWEPGLDYILFEAISKGLRRVNGHHIDSMDLDRIRMLAQQADGWWMEVGTWSIRREFVSLDQWRKESGLTFPS